MTTRQPHHCHLVVPGAALALVGTLSASHLHTSVPLPTLSARAVSVAPPRPHDRVRAAVTHLPLSFERTPAKDRTAEQFDARGMGYTLSLSATEARFTLAGPQPRPAGAHRLAGPAAPTAVVRMELEGANH